MADGDSRAAILCNMNLLNAQGRVGSIRKSIIEKNNGMITCRSEVGKGTEFVIKYMN